MPYLSCPSCRLRLDSRRAYSLDCCPRCLTMRGRRIALDAHLGGLRREGRMMSAVRAELAARETQVERPSPAT